MGSRRFLNNHHVMGSEALLSTFVQHFGEMNLEEGDRRGLDSRDQCSALLEVLTWGV